MTTATRDTACGVKRLREAGFSDAQAETGTDVLSEAMGQSFADLATKADIVAVRSDIAHLEERVKLRFGGFEQRVDRRLSGLEQRMNARFSASIPALRVSSSA